MSVGTMNFDHRLQPWSSDEVSDARFKKILLVMLIVFAIIGLVVPFVPVQEKQRKTAEDIPTRIAQIIIERKKQPLPKPKPAPEAVKKPEPVAKPKPKPKLDTPASPEQARKRAASAGVLAFASDLTALTSSPIATHIQGGKQLSARGSQKLEAQRQIITDPDLTRGSGGIATSTLSQDVGTAGLKGRETTRLSSPVAGLGGGVDDGQSGTGSGSGKQTRSKSDVIRYLDEQKAKFDRLYRRALRVNPDLHGQLVMAFTVMPDGSLQRIHIVSSELKDKELEEKIIAMFKSFNFGQLKVAAMDFNYPMDFTP